MSAKMLEIVGQLKSLTGMETSELVKQIQDLRSNTTNGGNGALRCANTPYK